MSNVIRKVVVGFLRVVLVQSELRRRSRCGQEHPQVKCLT